MPASSIHGPVEPDHPSADPAIPRPLILASVSPRRQELMREAGYEFTVVAPEIDEESYPFSLLPAELARRLAFEKASAVAAQYPSHRVLGADTVVAFGDRAMGKPVDAEDARRMLTLLSGTTQIVITGVALVCREEGTTVTRVAMSAARMRILLPLEIDAYIASGQWRGKAGAYGIQDPDPFVTRISGSHTNIVGLPMEVVRVMLASAGIRPTRQPGGP